MLLHKSSPAPACGLCCSCDRWVAGRRAAIPRPPAWDRSPEGWGHGCLRCQRAGQGSAGCCHQTSRQSECRALGLTLSPAAAPRIEAVLGRLRSLCTRPPWGCSSSRACMHTVSGQRGLTLPGPASCGRGEQSLREEGDESGPQAGREQHALPGNSHARAAGVLRCAATALVVCCRASIVAEGCAEIKRQVRSLSVLYARLCVPMPQCRHQILKPRGRCSEPRVPGASLPAAAAVINGSLPCAPAHRSRSQGRAPGGAVGSGPRRRARGGGGGDIHPQRWAALCRPPAGGLGQARPRPGGAIDCAPAGGRRRPTSPLACPARKQVARPLTGASSDFQRSYSMRRGWQHALLLRAPWPVPPAPPPWCWGRLGPSPTKQCGARTPWCSTLHGPCHTHASPTAPGAGHGYGQPPPPPPPSSHASRTRAQWPTQHQVRLPPTYEDHHHQQQLPPPMHGPAISSSVGHPPRRPRDLCSLWCRVSSDLVPPCSICSTGAWWAVTSRPGARHPRGPSATRALVCPGQQHW